MMLETLFNEFAQLPEIRQAGCIKPERTILYSPQITDAEKATLKALCRGVADTCNLFRLHRLPASKLHWKFEKISLCAFLLPGDIILTFLVDSEQAESQLNVAALLFDPLFTPPAHAS